MESTATKETLDRILFEITYSNRMGMIKLIEELSGEEYETTKEVFELAKLNKAGLRVKLKDLYDYYFNEYEECSKNVQNYC